MLPKNSKHYIIPTAEKLELDPETVEDVVSFYYNTLRKSLTGILHPRIIVENLGTFVVKKKELPKLLQQYDKHLRVQRPDTQTQRNIKQDIEKKRENLLHIMDLVDQQTLKKDIFYSEKKKRKQ